MDFTMKTGKKCRVYVSGKESQAVKIAAANLRSDMGKVFGAEGEETADPKQADIIIETPGKSQKSENLTDWDETAIRSELSDETGRPRKEAYMLSVQEGKLLIAGTDRRGTVYGIYELCRIMGVSPWYFWADVPVKKKEEMSLPDGYKKVDYPSVEYRGIFINDEEELEAWVQKHMGESTIGVRTYEKVFELLLRLRGNYIWPAMHVNSFNLVKENGALADRMGIVVGTSHCDMLMRSNNREWKPWLAGKGYQDVSYDYSIPGRNREILQEYWRESVEQNRDFEVCYTLGMRGIHDSGFETSSLENMTEEERKQAEIGLLSQIIKDQRHILSETLGRDTMMTFVPYKEVLPLYDGGLEVPEDMTLVWANDNYGYIRRYPSEKEKHRKGGNGIYYHNSYWAPPSMSYVFLCSIPLAHTRNELQKAYDEGIRKLWVLNSGAMKPLEQEIEFFLRLAWEIGKEKALTQDVDAYVENWIDESFTGGIGKETAKLLNDFSQLTNVRKLENMDTDAFSQIAYGDEAAVRIHRYEELFERGNALYESLPEEERDAFFQMVLMRIHAAYFTNLQYYYGDRSTLAYEQGKMQAAAEYVKLSRAFDDARRRMVIYYNKIMAEGKWDGIVNPEGFPPPRAAMMPVCTPPLAIGERRMLFNVWNEEQELIFTKPAVKWFEIGNGGEGEFDFEVEAPDYVSLVQSAGRSECSIAAPGTGADCETSAPRKNGSVQLRGTVRAEQRILVRVDVITEDRQGVILVRNLTDNTAVQIPLRLLFVETECPNVEDDGMVCVEADSAQSADFCVVKRLGRGEGNLVEARRRDCGIAQDGDCASIIGRHPLTYPVYFIKGGEFLLEIHRFPSLDSVGRIRIGVSVDGGEIQLVESESTDEWQGSWKDNVLNNVDRLYLKLPFMETGVHEIRLYAMDKYFAFSRFVIYTKERKDNNFAGIVGAQSLPKAWDVTKWTERFYGHISLTPRPIEYARAEKETDTLVVSDLIKCDAEYAPPITPQYYFIQGGSIFREKEGAIRIDAAAVLAQSEYAYSENFKWQHCGSESYGASGLAMYIRQPELAWTETGGAPSLNYRLYCSGGTYTIWLLAKFNRRTEAFLSAGIDKKPFSLDNLYCRGCLWRYEAEQIYRYVPIGRVKLEEGEHLLSIYSLASGMRFDRIYVTKGEELPPSDLNWR